jgi:hypothetical protein
LNAAGIRNRAHDRSQNGAAEELGNYGEYEALVSPERLWLKIGGRPRSAHFGKARNQNQGRPAKDHQPDNEVRQLDRRGLSGEVRRALCGVHGRDFRGGVLYTGKDELLAYDHAGDRTQRIERLGQI